jgi:hypothetical protein
MVKEKRLGPHDGGEAFAEIKPASERSGQCQGHSSSGLDKVLIVFRCRLPIAAIVAAATRMEFTASTPAEHSRSSALAVLRLMTNSNLVACWTGRSPGFSKSSGRPDTAAFGESCRHR